MNKLDVGGIIITFFGFLVALTMHEAAHAFVAKYLGDNSEETNSRATLNPIPHIDILGTIVFPGVMLLSGTSLLFGWAKRTQCDSRRFKKMKRDLNLVALSGPGFNFLISIVCGIAMKFMGYLPMQLQGGEDPVPRLLNAMAVANIVIGIFNLIPFPGSDGWKVLLNSLSYDKAQKLEQISTPLSLVVMLLLIMGIFSPIFQIILAIYYGIFIT